MNAGPLEDWVAGLLAPATAQPQPALAPAPVPAPAVAPEGAPPVNVPSLELPARFVSFRVGTESYALDVLRVREVLRSAEVVAVPGAPDSVLGVINLRGSIVPVVDARHRLGLEPPPVDLASRVLIIESGRQVVGLRVDSVAEVTTVHPEECEPPPAVGRVGAGLALRGVVRRAEEFLVLVDVDELLPAVPRGSGSPS